MLSLSLVHRTHMMEGKNQLLQDARGACAGGYESKHLATVRGRKGTKGRGKRPRVVGEV